MSFIKRRTRNAAIVGTLVVLALGGVAAFAYFTTSGEGNGEVKVSRELEPFKVEAPAVEGLTPGSSVEQTVTVRNASEKSAHLSEVEASIGTNSKEGEGCKKEWFHVTPAAQSAIAELAAGGTKSVKVTVSMTDPEAENQDACKGTSLTIHYAAH
jgi:hypothetical protein